MIDWERLLWRSGYISPLSSWALAFITSQCIGAVRMRKKYIDLNCIYTADPEVSK